MSPRKRMYRKPYTAKRALGELSRVEGKIPSVIAKEIFAQFKSAHFPDAGIKALRATQQVGLEKTARSNRAISILQGIINAMEGRQGFSGEIKGGWKRLPNGEWVRETEKGNHRLKPKKLTVEAGRKALQRAGLTVIPPRNLDAIDIRYLHERLDELEQHAKKTQLHTIDMNSRPRELKQKKRDE